MTEGLLTLTEAAQLLGVPLHRLQYDIKKKKVRQPHKTLMGKGRFYSTEDLPALREQLVNPLSADTQPKAVRQEAV